MGLTIRKLNGDTTFLLSFTQSTSTKLTVLIDPWLRGQSTWLHPSFQFSAHTIEPVVDTLAQVAENVDLIIISQDKPDHCHRETLCSWPQDKPVKILATAAAARKIRDWKHFQPDCIRELRAYSETDGSSVHYYNVPGVGMLTVANMSTKKDMTGLHNAIGITFEECQPRRDSRSESLDVLTPATTPHGLPATTHSLRSRVKSYTSLRFMNQQQQRLPVATPPLNASGGVCLSCIYSPHGIPPSLLEPYVRNHLRPLGALPVTALIHSFVMERNPWYMGGTVAAGTPGGIDLVKTLEGRVKIWISAHDEPKHNRGMSVKLLKTERYNEDQVVQLLSGLGYDSIELQNPCPGQDIHLAG